MKDSNSVVPGNVVGNVVYVLEVVKTEKSTIYLVRQPGNGCPIYSFGDVKEVTEFISDL